MRYPSLELVDLGMSMMMRLGPNSIALRSAAGMLSLVSQGWGMKRINHQTPRKMR